MAIAPPPAMPPPVAPRQQDGWSTIENFPPALVAVLAILVGVLLIVTSVVAHTSRADFPGIPKTVGYFYEINWSVNYVFAIPVALYFCACAMNATRRAISDLARAHMIVGPDGTPRDRNYLVGDWHRLARRFLYVGLILGAIAILASWREWLLDFSYNPTLDMATVKNTTGLLPGWNLAPLAHQGRHFLAAKAFGLFAFTAQGLVAAFYLLFICVIYGFATWIYRFTTDATIDELVPDTNSKDERKGFENFEPLIETLLSAALAFFVVFYLTRLDNEFVLSSASSLGNFIQTDLWYGFTKGVEGLFQAKADLFSLGEDLTYSIVMVGTGFGIALLTGFLVPAVIVRQAAISSRDRMDHPPEDMVVWPLRYPKPVQLILLMVLATACFLCYKLTLVIVGVAIGLGVRELFRSLK